MTNATNDGDTCDKGAAYPVGAVPGPLLTVKEAAQMLGVSTRTVYGWIKDGRIPSIRLGPKLLRVPLERLMDMMRENGPP